MAFLNSSMPNHILRELTRCSVKTRVYLGHESFSSLPRKRCSNQANTRSFLSASRNSMSSSLSRSPFLSLTGSRYMSSGAVIDTLPPRRALLYVPGDSKKKIIKSSHLPVDCVCLDMEDGVAESSKDAARELIRDSLDSVHFHPSTDICVRINPMSTQQKRAEQDIESVFSANKLPNSICLPKVECLGEVEWLCNKVYELLQDRPADQKVFIILMCESPLGFLNLYDVCKELGEISTMLNCNVIPDSIIFGSDDYCAAVGATRTESAEEISYVRQKLIMICKIFNLQAIDMVHNDFKDSDGLLRNCVQGRNMGYNGKQVIHPNQVLPVQSAFSPSAEQVTWAKGLVQAFEAAESTGTGAINYQGRMIDMPLVHQARNLLQIADRLHSK